MKNNNKSIIVVLYGPSCSGKDTLKDQLIKDIPNIKCLVPYTTREPREYEENGKPMYSFNNFFNDITHLKKCVGLMKDWKGEFRNLFKDEWVKWRLNTYF